MRVQKGNNARGIAEFAKANNFSVRQPDTSGARWFCKAAYFEYASQANACVHVIGQAGDDRSGLTIVELVLDCEIEGAWKIGAAGGRIPTNFKFDLTTSGAINSSDSSAVKARSGLMLP